MRLMHCVKKAMGGDIRAWTILANAQTLKARQLI